MDDENQDLKNIMEECVDDTVERMRQDLFNRIQETSSYSNHLSNVISGLNHEISPWLGGALNALDGVVSKFNPIKNDKEQDRIRYALTAIEQSIELLSTISSNVKQLKEHSISVQNIKGTIDSWVRITLLDRYIKEKIHQENIEIDIESLNFEAKHSPMYVAQIIFNLTKNAVEHNSHMLDKLKIKIYGNKENSCIVVEDNGKGIDPEIHKDLFRAGTTTKKGNLHQNGLGLSACMDYSIIMGATLVCDSYPGRTRFFLRFDDSYEKMPSGEWACVKQTYRDHMKIKEQRDLGSESAGYAAIRKVSSAWNSTH